MPVSDSPFLKYKQVGRARVRVYGTMGQRLYHKQDVHYVCTELGIQNPQFRRVQGGEFRHAFVIDTDGQRRNIRVVTSAAIKQVFDSASVFVPAEYAKRLGVEPTELSTVVHEHAIGSKILMVLRDERVLKDFHVQGEPVNVYLPEYNICIDFVERGGKYNAEKINTVQQNMPGCRYMVFNGSNLLFNIFASIADLIALMRQCTNNRLGVLPMSAQV